MAKVYNFKMFRGDTLEFQLAVSGLETAEFDAVEFTAKGKFVDETPAIYKSLADGVTYSNGLYNVKIDPEDTNDLTPSEYVYDVQIKIDGNVFTVLYGKLNILEDVTRG